MPTAPDAYVPNRDPLFLAYFDLYSRYRGLIAALAARGIVPAEPLEMDVTTWMREHRAQLLPEAWELFRGYVLQVAAGIQPPGPPPAAGRGTDPLPPDPGGPEK